MLPYIQTTAPNEMRTRDRLGLGIAADLVLVCINEPLQPVSVIGGKGIGPTLRNCHGDMLPLVNGPAKLKAPPL